MKEYLIEYYPNGCIKHEQFYDEQGNHHRESGLPADITWYKNGKTRYIMYVIHGRRHNINNPTGIRFNQNGKIWVKDYRLNKCWYIKLNWMNQIKSI